MCRIAVVKYPQTGRGDFTTVVVLSKKGDMHYNDSSGVDPASTWVAKQSRACRAPVSS